MFCATLLTGDLNFPFSHRTVKKIKFKSSYSLEVENLSRNVKDVLYVRTFSKFKL